MMRTMSSSRRCFAHSSHRDQLRCTSKFKSWLWSIALNEIRACFPHRRPAISLEQRAHGDLADPAPSALALCERIEQDERLRAGLASLTPRPHGHPVGGSQWLELQRRLPVRWRVSMAAFKSVHFRARQRLASALSGPSEQRPVRRAVVRLGRRKSESRELRSAA